jgi:hypothetical protein
VRFNDILSLVFLAPDLDVFIFSGILRVFVVALMQR